MRNSIFLSRRAEKFLAALRDAKLYSRLRTAIDDLEQNARPFGCVKLAGEPDLYRIRVGDYRIIYQVNDLKLTVLVLAIGHRREVSQTAWLNGGRKRDKLSALPQPVGEPRKLSRPARLQHSSDRTSLSCSVWR
jgi:mRNA interferase RelE/StbE